MSRVGCWAHTRRYIERALETSPKEAGTWLQFIQGLYRVERQAREKSLDHVRRHALRAECSRPLLDEFWKLVIDLRAVTLPQSPLGKGLTYACNQRAHLDAYLDHPEAEIDDNI